MNYSDWHHHRFRITAHSQAQMGGVLWFLSCFWGGLLGGVERMRAIFRVAWLSGTIAILPIARVTHSLIVLRVLTMLLAPIVCGLTVAIAHLTAVHMLLFILPLLAIFITYPIFVVFDWRLPTTLASAAAPHTSCHHIAQP